ncbi:hypothetical protein HYPSUDRAFT_79865 [Hypholoma sublateritium FD-334 SS-4]|uniref:Uncharacterized protein n=1 Tax=Hypholoma sublateritium (strain FD-334 SS-4) TaxID=945553 RepID=A0A0D2KQH2_HYPSF|nr:hypothetical protein HYPSUDRAFT_79865 [Hypholoma sublateritium FD-334 SS-4]
MRLSSAFAVFTLAIIPAVFSTPVIPRDHVSDISLTKRTPESPPEVIQRVLHERFNSLHASSRQAPALEAIYDRSLLGGLEKVASRTAAKAVKKAAKADRVTKALDKGKTLPKRPSNAKVTFGSAARAKLDELGLHGKDRKKAKQYHKNIVKQDMKNHPGADSARIFHLAHKGGNDPNERNHITAGYYKAPAQGKPGEQIKSPWAKNFEAKNPDKKTKGLFHVYPEDQKRKTHVPSSLTRATEASAARKKVEADKAIAKAKADEDAKTTRVNQERQAGQSLSHDDKKAQREAAKAAKAAKKKKT